ncbi:MAG: transcription termination/antitermination NusG family protein [Bacteroidota bacterium]|nr:transcription termination/antitermination NusG family protein [Bacteroidota bacterium]
MQKSWYIVYTKAKCEKKVAILLTKRKIENFCPFASKQINHLRKNKLIHEPLFSSYVFVNIDENDIPLVKKLENVVNLVYWKGMPAKIKNEEIEDIKYFTNNYQGIKLERTNVNTYDEAKMINGPSYKMDGKLLVIKNRFLKVNLPSLGFTMIAEMESESIIGREIILDNKEMLLQ